MTEDLHSSSWYRVAALRPRLRGHVRIHRHHYRGERWYVLEDRVSRRMHRFNPVSHYVIGLMDGYRSVEEIWQSGANRFGDDAPTQDEMIRLLGQLHAADVLQSEVAPDVAELLRRAHRTRKRTWLQVLLSPMAVRIPLFDPDRLLERLLPWTQPLFGWFGFLLWCAVVGAGVVGTAMHWDELTRDITDRVLAPENLVILFLVYPLVKALHEFGHACATKVWGGEVHEMGVMLLVLMPIPYVDASAATALAEARRRVVIGAAGMMVEVFIASIALFLWIEAEPGLVRGVLYNVMLIAGVSTVIFNGNPLLRFDGYYILADLLQMPNLRARSQQYLVSVIERRLFGAKQPEADATPSERVWFVFFAVASFLYRNFVILSIALFIGAKYFFVGVLLALWVLFGAIVFPLAKGVIHLATHPRLRRQRARAVLATTAVTAALALVFLAVPVPLWTMAEGVTWAPEDAQVRARTDGFVTRAVARPGAAVRRGDVLIETANPELQPQARVLEAQLRLLRVRAQAELATDRVQWQLTQEEITSVRAQLDRVREKLAELVIVSPTDGRYALAKAEDLPDRFLRQGEPLGYVVPEREATVRVLVAQESVDLVRSRTRAVEVRRAGAPAQTLSATVAREVPSGSHRLPNLALSSAGGGGVAMDPRAAGEPKALQKWFEFELRLPELRAATVGERVHVRFEHDAEPLAWRLYRWTRQLFMARFTV